MTDDKKDKNDLRNISKEGESDLAQDLETVIDEFFDPDKDQVFSLNDKLNEFINENPYEETTTKGTDLEIDEIKKETATKDKFKKLKIETELENLKKSIKTNNKTIPIITEPKITDNKETQPDLNQDLKILKDKSLGKTEKKRQNSTNKEKEKDISNSDIDKSLKDFLKKLNT